MSRTDRKLSAALKANLDAMRLSPVELKANMAAAIKLRDESTDVRVRARMADSIQRWQQWLTEYENPSDQVIQHEFPDNISIEIVKQPSQ